MNQIHSNEIILATTTSTRDSGLLDILVPQFEKQSGYTVKIIAVGSGQALQMGKEGNADVLLVHSPSSEEEFMTAGYGIQDSLVMYNDFVIVGPADDLAGIKGKTSTEAFKSIYTTKSLFISRGDDSGTHSREKQIWKKVELTPDPKNGWYLESGSGMTDTLRIASEKHGYTLTDRATYLSLKDTLSLEILVEGDKSLLNIYSVITVNPQKFPMVNHEGAESFADFMLSPDTQIIIAEFGKEKFGQSLFTPAAGKTEAELGK
ncbi:MAG: tungsten ABC transporter substrate-binding protein [Anaerolineae bacterium]|nr:tungsten ABC transporter substrate-binding protein [Anaerolineae bacterium]